MDVAKIHMEEGAAQISNNFDYEKPPGARLRAGYSRLLGADGTTVMKADNAPSSIFVFERDDDESRLLIAYSGSLDSHDPGDPEWT